MRRSRTPGLSATTGAPPLAASRLGDALDFGARPQTADGRVTSSPWSPHVDVGSARVVHGSSDTLVRPWLRPGDVPDSVVFPTHSSVTGELGILVAFPRAPAPRVPLERPGTGDRGFSSRSRAERESRHAKYWATQVAESKQRREIEARENFEKTQHLKWKLLLQLATVSRRRNANWHRQQARYVDRSFTLDAPFPDWSFKLIQSEPNTKRTPSRRYRKRKAREKRRAMSQLRASVRASTGIEKDPEWDTTSEEEQDDDDDERDAGEVHEVMGGVGEGAIVDESAIRRLSRTGDEGATTSSKTVFTEFWLSLGSKPLVTPMQFRERVKAAFELNWQTADRDLDQLFMVLDEDCDDLVDWRDFVLYLRVMERPRERVRRVEMTHPVVKSCIPYLTLLFQCMASPSGTTQAPLGV